MLTLNPFRREAPTCPGCSSRARIGRGRCLYCHAQVYIPILYFRMLWLLVVLSLAAIGTATFRRDHAGTWLLALLLAAIPLRLIFGILIVPWFELGAVRYSLPFPVWYVACCVTTLIYWEAWSWLHLGLGASKDEINENWDFFSVPLAWINSAFLIRSDKWPSDVIGIIMGNAFFYALGTFALYAGVRTRLNRNRAIRLNITDGKSEDEE